MLAWVLACEMHHTECNVIHGLNVFNPSRKEFRVSSLGFMREGFGVSSLGITREGFRVSSLGLGI
jgi:hypothetical protein